MQMLKVAPQKIFLFIYFLFYVCYYVKIPSYVFKEYKPDSKFKYHASTLSRRTTLTEHAFLFSIRFASRTMNLHKICTFYVLVTIIMAISLDALSIGDPTNKNTFATDAVMVMIKKFRT